VAIAIPSVDCPALPGRLKPLSLDNHLWLGTFEGDMTARLGTPSYRKEAWRAYDFRGKVKGNCDGGSFDQFASILLNFKKGRVDALQVWQVTSC
jgi:hypothetical protein